MSSFDERAKDWDSDPAKVERARVVADAIREVLSSTLGTHRSHQGANGSQGTSLAGLTGLEVGCGTGLLSFALQPYFSSITLADTSEGMLAVLAEKINAAGVSNMHPLMIDLAHDPLPDARFDVIYSLMTFHHIRDTDLILHRLFQLMNPGGILCIVDLEEEDGSFHGQAVTDVHRGFERTELNRMIETAGFGKANFSSVYQIKKRVSGVERAFPLFLAAAPKN